MDTDRLNERIREQSRVDIASNTQYEELLTTLIHRNTMRLQPRLDRTKTGTTSIFGTRLEYDLRPHISGSGEVAVDIPLLNTKRVPFKSVLGELLWFLSGSTDNNDLHKLGVTVWDEWADANNQLGKVYGYQWRNWDGKVDQLKNLLDGLLKDPMGRRHIITGWNPTDIENGELALPPCHMTMQFFVDLDSRGQGQLSLQVYQRSADIFLGVPFNIASYATLLTMVASVVDMIPKTFIWVGGDTHLYDNHYEQAVLQYERHRLIESKKRFLRTTTDLPDVDNYLMGLTQPKLILKTEDFLSGDPLQDLLGYTMDSFKIENYQPYPTIKADVAI